MKMSNYAFEKLYSALRILLSDGTIMDRLKNAYNYNISVLQDSQPDFPSELHDIFEEIVLKIENIEKYSDGELKEISFSILDLYTEIIKINN